MPIVEDPFQVGPYQPAIHERSEQDAVLHVVLDEGPAVDSGEEVLVNPPLVGPPALLVDEAVRRLPRRDLAAPPHGNPAQAQAVVDQGARLPADGQRRGDARSSHTQAGVGPDGTWMRRLPLWAIDQAFTGERVRATRSDVIDPGLSEHRMLVVDIEGR